MNVTVYRRSYPVDGSPVSLSLVPLAVHQRHTYPAAGRVYEAEYSEVRVHAPDGATVNAIRNVLR
jgi:hypothetical protein